MKNKERKYNEIIDKIPIKKKDMTSKGGANHLNCISHRLIR